MTRTVCTIMLWTIASATMAIADSTLGNSDRINLVDFARVVRYSGDSPATLKVHELDREPDGWEAWRQDHATGDGEDANGPYMIGVEWDEPRDVAEVNVEFRHAVAERHKIKVQYFQKHWPTSKTGGWTPLDDPFHGKWVTAKSEWWAGDRDVTFVFAPYNQEQPGPDAPAVSFRRTYRLRILCGTREPPPVRYIRAYGLKSHAQATFDIRFDPDSQLKPPVVISAINGYLLNSDTSTTLPSTRIDTLPASVSVRYTQDDLETTTRTIVTLRSTHDETKGMSFLPAEVVQYGNIRVPLLGVVIAHRGSTKNLQAGQQPGMSIFDRVQKEPEQTFDRARREIPKLKKTAQEPFGFYLPLGPPDARQEIAVRHDGSIFLRRCALKVRAGDNDRLQWPANNRWQVRLSTGEPPYDHIAEGNIKQRLLDGYLPIVINTWQHNGITYEQTSVATFLAGEPADVRGDETVVLLSRLNIRNTANQSTDAVVRFSIDTGKNPHLGDNTLLNETLTLNNGHVLARGQIKDGKEERYEPARYRFYLSTPSDNTEVIHNLGKDARGSDIAYRRALPAGESQTIEWRVPYITLDQLDEQQQIADLDFDRALHFEADRWRKIIAKAAVIEIPNPLLNDFYKAQLSHIFITADRDPYSGMRALPAGTYGYNVCLNESCHQIRSLEIRGLHDEAEQFLDAIIQGQSSSSLHGRFKSKVGVFHGLPSKHGDYQTFKYNLDHGFALWMLNEHYWYTRDKAWLTQVADALIAACDFVTNELDVPAQSNTLGREDTFWGRGLLPPGHLEDPPEWLWWFAVNAYAYRGMQATAQSLREIEHPQANRITLAAAAFGRHLNRSCKEAMIRAPVVRLRDGTYVPHQPTRSRLRGRDLGWIRDAAYGPIHLIDCGVYADHSPEAEWILRDTEDNVFIGEARGRKLEDFDRQWFSWGGITLQSYLLPNPLVYLRRGQAKHAIRAFYNSLAANVYADVRTFCEHPIKGYGIGQGPFFKPPDESAFLVWLRHLLIMENGNHLDLLAGVPVSWLEPEKRINIQQAATWFGPMNLEVTSSANPPQLTIDLSAPRRNPPKTIRLFLRYPKTIRTITVNGKPASTFDDERNILTLPGSIGHATIVVTYNH